MSFLERDEVSHDSPWSDIQEVIEPQKSKHMPAMLGEKVNCKFLI
jgi:hypothetical protein